MDKIVTDYLEELSKCLKEIKGADLFEMVRALDEAYKRGRRTFVFGNGGSAATAAHLALHLRQAGKPGKAFDVICLTDNVPLITAIANDDRYSSIFEAQLQGALNTGDVVFAISGSGNSENVLEAAHYGKENGGVILALVGFGGGKLAPLAHHKIVFSSHNYGPLEDAHLSLVHLIAKLLHKAVSKG